jgi:hypothetical protein
VTVVGDEFVELGDEVLGGVPVVYSYSRVVSESSLIVRAANSNNPFC